jgi:carboxymethylenebutenolidase
MDDFENDRRNRESERRSLLPGGIDRRQVLTASLAAGFAAAVRPAAAQTAIVTDANGLTAGDVKIPLAEGELPAYRAMPSTVGPFPVILVVQEYSACTNTSATFVGASLSKATWPLLRSCISARAASLASRT